MVNILVLSPHPDDEAIAVGGTIRRHVLAGDHVKVVFVSSGENAIETNGPEREEESKAAMEILGYQEIDWWRFPDGKLRKHSEKLAIQISVELEQFEPDAVYLPHRNDNHGDHSAVFDAFQQVLGKSKAPNKILCYEVWTPIQNYTTYNQITEEIEDKLAAIRAHKSQNSRNQFDMGAIGLNRFRGVMTGWKQGYVEVFEELVP